ncbi:DUF1828 domain-containing protein [Emticicia sp. SJ17W-69]|uniref:DUF1828 domain-containing protein n=1 Tax=Emticicia sp. SJ17W-69 TaxID=3421657 RepID=UPI003EBE7D65
MNNLSEIKNILQNQFMDMFDLKQIRPSIFQIVLPYYYSDGDIFEIFIEQEGDIFILQDFGLSLMKLSYDSDTESDYKRDLIKKILRENQVEFDDGNIYLNTSIDFLLPNLMVFLDTISKVSALSLLNKKVSRNQFYEVVEKFLAERFRNNGFESKFLPESVPYVEDYLAPHAIIVENKIPICLFPIATNDRCDQVTISVQHYKLNGFNPYLIGLYENMEDISSKKISKVTNLMDKQFSFFFKNEKFITNYLQDKLN